jgi:hypothetical protein
MGFESLLLIVVVVEAVWILSSLFRGSEEERRPPAGRPAQRPGTTPNRTRPPATNVDRFLEEINRRRREAAERQSAQRPAPPPPARTPSRQGPPPTRPSPPPAQRFPPVEVVARPQPRVVEAVAVVEERKAPAAQPLPSRAPATSGTETFVPSTVTDVRMAVAVTSPAPVGRATVSPVLAELLPLLRGRKSLRSAFLLKEIFGRPLCQRGLGARREIR